MPKIRYQQGQAALDVCVLSIPALKGRRYEAVAQIVQTGRTSALVQHISGETQMIPDPRQSSSAVTDRAQSWLAVPDKWAVWLYLDSVLLSLVVIAEEFMSDGVGQRYKSGLVELCFVDAESCCLQIDIL